MHHVIRIHKAYSQSWYAFFPWRCRHFSTRVCVTHRIESRHTYKWVTASICAYVIWYLYIHMYIFKYTFTYMFRYISIHVFTYIYVHTPWYVTEYFDILHTHSCIYSHRYSHTCSYIFICSYTVVYEYIFLHPPQLYKPTQTCIKPHIWNKTLMWRQMCESLVAHLTHIPSNWEEGDRKSVV